MNKPKVLVVDDEPINIRLVASALQDKYKILVALTGEAALDLSKNELPNLILLDINMPHMNGFEVLEQMKICDSLKNIPVIFLTGDKTEKTIVSAFNAGAVDYIIKPFQIEELTARVENQIAKYMLQVSLQNANKYNAHLLAVIDTYVAYAKVNKEGVIQDISSNFSNLFKCSRETAIGKNVNILKSGTTPEEQYAELWATVTAGQTFVHEIEDRSFSGGTNWYQVTVSPNYGMENEMDGYIAFYENIDEKIQFKKNAQTDALTQLANRFKIDELLIQEEQRSVRYKYEFSVILLDIDHFKEVNDTYGHQVGDSVLQEFANILSNNIRSSDVVGRWGGEEFLVICTHTDMDGAYALAESLRQKIENHIFPSIGHKTASFGIAVFQVNDSLESLFKKADEALYRAKEAGRNQVR